MVIVILHLFLVSSLKVAFGFVIPIEDFCNLDRENRGFLTLGNFNTDDFEGFCHRDQNPKAYHYMMLGIADIFQSYSTLRLIILNN